MSEEPATPEPNTSEPDDEQPHAQLYTVLSKLGVRTLRAEYSGYGDSGCIEKIRAFNRRECEVKLPGTPVPLPLITTRFDPATRSTSSAPRSAFCRSTRRSSSGATTSWKNAFPAGSSTTARAASSPSTSKTRSGRLSHTFNEPTTMTEDF